LGGEKETSKDQKTTQNISQKNKMPNCKGSKKNYENVFTVVARTKNKRNFIARGTTLVGSLKEGGAGSQ